MKKRVVLVEVFPCPYGSPGDRLWVRETWAEHFSSFHEDDPYYSYRADRERPGVKWLPSIHMPRWASRIDLEVTGMRVERLQDISEEDVIAEGIGGKLCRDFVLRSPCSDQFKPVEVHAFAGLWNSINGKKHPWESNPWVWVIEFRRLSYQRVGVFR